MQRSLLAALAAFLVLAVGSQAAPAADPIELVWPANPLALGDLDERASSGADDFDMFNNVDYEGWGDADGVNERMEVVPDPAGSGKPVVEIFNVATDRDDQYSNSSPHTGPWYSIRDQVNGTTTCSAFGVYIKDNAEFPWPTRWMLFHQNHSGSGSPNTAVEVIDTVADADTLRDELALRVRNGSGGDAGIVYPLGDIQLGHWHFIVVCAKFATSGQGWAKAWESVDVAPDVTQPPDAIRMNVTTNWASGFTWLGIYAGALATAESQKVYLWGYGRSAGDTPARAIELAELPTAGAPEPPPPPPTEYNPACRPTCDEQIAQLQTDLAAAVAQRNALQDKLNRIAAIVHE
jgi:hypothetical protein